MCQSNCYCRNYLQCWKMLCFSKFDTSLRTEITIPLSCVCTISLVWSCRLWCSLTSLMSAHLGLLPTTSEHWRWPSLMEGNLMPLAEGEIHYVTAEKLKQGEYSGFSQSVRNVSVWRPSSCNSYHIIGNTKATLYNGHELVAVIESAVCL